MVTNTTTVKKATLKNPIMKVTEPVVSEVVGLDLGYAQCNIVSSDWRNMFMSVVKLRSEVVVSGLADSEGYTVTNDAGIWNVGSKGEYDISSNPRLTTDTDMAKLLATFGLYQQGTNKAVIDLLVSGLPITEFMNQATCDDFTNRLTGDFHYGFGFNQNFIQVKKALALPQSAGAFFDYALNDDGSTNMQNLDLTSEDILVLDIGGNTTDGCIMEGAAFSQDSFTLKRGVHKVQKELQKLIYKNHNNYLAPSYKLDGILKTGIAKIGGVDTEVQNLCDSAIKTTLPEFINELSMWVPDFRRFSAILMAGGGTNLYHQFIVEEAGIPVISLPTPDYANANGYLKYGKLQVKEGLI